MRTRIASLWGGDGGFDPYVTAFSDVYQNLCGEGSFAGKGVYDVAAFVAGTAGKIRENTVLSHDLLEGALCGASLACDISLYDSQPASLRGWMPEAASLDARRLAASALAFALRPGRKRLDAKPAFPAEPVQNL